MCNVLEACSLLFSLHFLLTARIGGKSTVKDFKLAAEACLPIINAILADVRNKKYPQKCFLNIDLPTDVLNHKCIIDDKSSAFVEKMQTNGDLNLIGQFGVGFYSVYLVADYVEVISKYNDDKQYVWESKVDGAFAISEDTWNEPLGRGTEIRLHLREEAGEYAEESKLKCCSAKLQCCLKRQKTAVLFEKLRGMHRIIW
ncbi:hypothetical protein POM88_034145 [Heracleum sosnowskyi]|uniref:Heat shock protein 90 n=1 Tax=Heracleum sosnowskyi TaxID=360622 RepID=A0AAD8HKQ7_9APIA|nr:hypothetical protein POM88_034145 [Heracleum sosnowskyi]